MSPGNGTPRLVALDGRLARASWDIPPGQSTIGRDPVTGIVVDDQSVSRRHAAVVRTGGQVMLNDLGSTNGTWVNGRRLVAAHELRSGDTIRLGEVSLAFEAAAPPPRSYGFGDVHGAVHAGTGDQYLNGRDHYDHRSYRYTATNDYDPWDEAFQGKGPGRILMILGGLLALAGFSLVLYFFYVAFNSGIDDPVGQSPFGLKVGGVPVLAVAVGAFFTGGVLAGIGSGMSKAARKRTERRREGRDE